MNEAEDKTTPGPETRTGAAPVSGSAATPGPEAASLPAPVSGADTIPGPGPFRKTGALPNSDDTPLGPDSQWVTCPKCGERYLSIYARCPNCTLQLKPEEIVIDTHNLKRKPTTSPGPAQRQDVLSQTGNIILQFLPSGLCVMLALAQPTVLGRRTGDLALDGYELVDLTDYGGYRHGVSRAHCVLERQGSALMVTDLGSRNGTYLNDLRLMPHKPQQVVHSDRLILGTLHAVVAFSVAQPGGI